MRVYELLSVSSFWGTNNSLQEGNNKKKAVNPRVIGEDVSHHVP